MPFPTPPINSILTVSEESIRFHSFRAQSHKTASTSDAKRKFRLSRVLLITGYKSEVPITLLGFYQYSGRAREIQRSIYVHLPVYYKGLKGFRTGHYNVPRWREDDFELKATETLQA